jgi:hypothetical protein
LIVRYRVEDNNVKAMISTDYVLLMTPCSDNQGPRSRLPKLDYEIRQKNYSGGRVYEDP